MAKGIAVREVEARSNAKGNAYGKLQPAQRLRAAAARSMANTAVREATAYSTVKDIAVR